jgi:hypothetical protein
MFDVMEKALDELLSSESLKLEPEAFLCPSCLLFVFFVNPMIVHPRGSRRTRREDTKDTKNKGKKKRGR